VIVSIKAKTVQSGVFAGNSTVQIQNQDQYCQQQDKKYKKSGMSTQNTIQMPLFFLHQKCPPLFINVINGEYGRHDYFHENLENQMHICINTVRPIMCLYVPSSE
jgi:hypothetical protein